MTVLSFKIKLEGFKKDMISKSITNDCFFWNVSNEVLIRIEGASYSRRPYGQIRHFSAGALGLLLGFLYDRMECPEHSDSIGKLLEPSELVL